MPRNPAAYVLVNGGFIAAEFSHVAARAAASVTILQHAERMLKEFDADLVLWRMAYFKALGFNVQTRITVERIEKAAGVYQISSSADGKQSMVEADLVVLFASRAPIFDEFDLAAAGIDTE